MTNLETLADEFDGIEVDANGRCHWSDVANAQTQLRAKLRLAAARPAHPTREAIAIELIAHGEFSSNPNRNYFNALGAADAILKMFPLSGEQEKPCIHHSIIGLNGKWHCQKCGRAVVTATAYAVETGK